MVELAGPGLYPGEPKNNCGSLIWLVLWSILYKGEKFRWCVSFSILDWILMFFCWGCLFDTLWTHNFHIPYDLWPGWRSPCSWRIHPSSSRPECHPSIKPRPQQEEAMRCCINPRDPHHKHTDLHVWHLSICCGKNSAPREAAPKSQGEGESDSNGKAWTPTLWRNPAMFGFPLLDGTRARVRGVWRNDNKWMCSGDWVSTTATQAQPPPPVPPPLLPPAFQPPKPTPRLCHRSPPSRGKATRAWACPSSGSRIVASVNAEQLWVAPPSTWRLPWCSLSTLPGASPGCCAGSDWWNHRGQNCAKTEPFGWVSLGFEGTAQIQLVPWAWT